MKRLQTVLILFALLGGTLFLSAQNRQLVEIGGVLVEQFDANYKDDNRFTQDNFTYAEGLTFTYSYRFYDKDGKEYLHRSAETAGLDHEKAWQLVPALRADEESVRAVQMTVLHGLQGIDKMKPDYNRTVVQYDYLTADGNARYTEVTGIVENEKNIWMHPPRSKLFRILELNPFPYIKSPYKVGEEWTWTQQIGAFWSDVRWKEWKGAATNTYHYKITDKKMVRTTFGILECYEIAAKANSELGETALTALFNPDYGFVQTNYTNIDGSKIVMELTGRASESTLVAQNNADSKTK